MLTILVKVLDLAASLLSDLRASKVLLDLGQLRFVLSWILLLLDGADRKDWFIVVVIVVSLGGVPRLWTFIKLKVCKDGALISLISGTFRWDLQVWLALRVAMVHFNIIHAELLSDGLVLLCRCNYLKFFILLCLPLRFIFMDTDRDRGVCRQRHALFWILLKTVVLDIRWRFTIMILLQFRDELVHRMIHFLFKLLLATIWHLIPRCLWCLYLAYNAALLRDYGEVRFVFLDVLIRRVAVLSVGDYGEDRLSFLSLRRRKLLMAMLVIVSSVLLGCWARRVKDVILTNHSISCSVEVHLRWEHII